MEDASVEPFTASSSSRDDTWFPLTIAQRGMWFAQRMAPRKAFFNLAELIEIHGVVDVAAFYAALRHVTIEAAATRLRFVEIDGEPLQSVNPEISGLIPFTDLSDERYFWYHRSHHILIDGFAGGLIARRVAELYSELQEGRTPEIVPYESLSDLVTEDHAFRDSERYKIDRDYWV